MLCFNDLKPLLSSRGPLFWQSMIEEGFDGGLFTLVVIRVIWDEAHETTWESLAI